MGGEKKREPTERVGLSFPATIQSAQEVGESLGKPLLEKVGIQHAKLVTDGADCSTATVPGVLNSAIGLGRVKTPGGSIDAPRSRRGGHARSFFRIGGSFGLEVLLKRIPGVLSGSATADGRVSATTMPSLLP